MRIIDTENQKQDIEDKKNKINQNQVHEQPNIIS